MAKTGQDWVERLDLQKHPEGGYYRETYRGADLVNQDQSLSRYSGKRNTSTAIYYLLMGQDFSAFHKLKSDEIFHFYAGSALDVHIISEQGDYSYVKLGNNPDNNEVLQLVIPYGNWFASAVSEAESYSLIGCTVSPGFDFHDFFLGEKDNLLNLYPQHTQIINRFTR
jgi:predicted cupin superfamily sugar epimerase